MYVQCTGSCKKDPVIPMEETSCCPAVLHWNVTKKIIASLETRMLFNEWSWEINIFGVRGFCCGVLCSRSLKRERNYC